MPQISPMNWSIIITMFIWALISGFSFLYFNKFKNFKQKNIKSFSKEWNW
uniref:ATP synthase subunit 8 n=1 Tax=Leptotrombidium pallidum TaxID=279272 RepID=Q4W8D7_9ACAR|nr:ATP synthase F0 subunit 8 [Leptotrombidium pallidum]BAD99502.1 ATP synthase subunit 8 [Leptotrombidium pallidum]